MRGWRSVLLGFCTAVLSSTILAGSLLLSLVENGYEIAQQPMPTYTLTSSPLTTQFIIPGRPARTATATISATATPTPTFVPPTFVSPTFVSPTFVSPTTCPPPPGWIAIVILPDDTLSGLSRAYQVVEETLAFGNCMEPGIAALQPGMVFYIPGTPPLPPSPPPATPIFFFTPIYTYEEPPTNTNSPTPTATTTADSTATQTPSPSPTETATSTDTVMAPLHPPGLPTSTYTPSSYPFYGFSH
jgi:hypothetical protein